MDTFARLARSSCNECGSSLITWTTVRELAFYVLPELRKRVFELADFCGYDAEAWVCRKCSYFGAFAADFAL